MDGGHNCCGIPHEEGGITWNGETHRTVIERAIWLIQANDPTSEFLSLWANRSFRDGLQDGLLDADWVQPYDNWADLFQHGLFTSHFWNPRNGKNIAENNSWLWALATAGGVKDPWTNAFQANRFYLTLAASLHDRVRFAGRPPEASVLRHIGYSLGLALHYFTDLTQPMHAANVANIIGGPDDAGPTNDKRHRMFEMLAEEIVSNPSDPDYWKLVVNPGRLVIDFVGFRNHRTPSEITSQAAEFAYQVYLLKVHGPASRMSRWGENPWKREDAVPAFEQALPTAQINTAGFLYAWARYSPMTAFQAAAESLSVPPLAVSATDDAASLRHFLYALGTCNAYKQKYVDGKPGPEAAHHLVRHFVPGDPSIEQRHRWTERVAEVGWEQSLRELTDSADYRTHDHDPLLSDLAQAPNRFVRSDWVAIAGWPERRQPGIFVYRDKQVRPGFTYTNSKGEWVTDFVSFSPVDLPSPKAFAAFYHPVQKHPALFYGDSAGDLQYADIGERGWFPRPVVAGGRQVRFFGGLAAVWEKQRNSPALFYRDHTGLLHFLYSENGRFHTGPIGTAESGVGGALSAIYDPNPSGAPGQRPEVGHPAVAYIGGDGRLHYWHVRNGAWQHVQIPIADPGADPEMISTVLDPSGSVGIFLGIPVYAWRDKPERVRERKYSRLQYMRIVLRNDRYVAEHVFMDGVQQVQAWGPLAGVSGPNGDGHHLGVFCRDAVTEQMHYCYWSANGWRDETAAFQDPNRVAGPVVAAVETNAAIRQSRLMAVYRNQQRGLTLFSSTTGTAWDRIPIEVREPRAQAQAAT